MSLQTRIGMSYGSCFEGVNYTLKSNTLVGEWFIIYYRLLERCLIKDCKFSQVVVFEDMRKKLLLMLCYITKPVKGSGNKSFHLCLICWSSVHHGLSFGLTFLL